MAYRRIKQVSAILVAAGVVGYGLYAVSAQESPPVLAQAPLNVSAVTPPAFIMAVDDSRSMAYQAVFPTTESPGSGGGGGACWSRSSSSSSDWSFFSGPDQLRQTRSASQGTCAYMYYMTSVRDLNNNAIPPIDAFGFARSPAYSYSYYDPGTLYTPWAKGDGTYYPDSDPANPKLHPHDSAGIGKSLVSNMFDTNGRSQFYAHQGMRLPGGIKYQLVNNADCGGLTRGTGRTVPSAGHTMSASCQLYLEYYPATFFLPTSTLPELPGAPNAYSGMTGTEILNACGSGCSLWKFTIPAANVVAARNFANWFTYYGNRQRATIAAASHALAEVNNMRVGYFTIGNRVNVTMYDMDDTTQKKQLFGSNGTGTPSSTTLLGLLANGSSTPNAHAIDHIGKQFQRKDNGPPIISACQKNAGMLFTDGATNSQSVTATAMTELGSPFDPTAANTMAAIASKYYFNRNNTKGALGAPGESALRWDLPAGKVPVSEECKTLSPTSTEWKRLDCQTNLHMNLYAITLGMRGERFNPTASPKQDPFVTPVSWPTSQPANDSVGTVDDLWHATLNTRGEFINANTSSEITAAMRRILAAVNAGKSPAGTLAVSGARIGAGSISVQPSYEVRNNGTDWFGQLTAEALSSNPLTGQVSYAKLWDASERLEAQGAASRNIKFGRLSGGTVQSADFSAANLSLADLCVSGRCTSTELTGLATGMNNTRAVAYLRGARTDEGVLRTRTTLLGDIVNSTPIVVGANDDYGYETLGGTLATSYKTYLASKKTAARPLVVVGANDGMFHVFDGRSTSPPGGNEIYAYVPATAVGYMGDLLYPYNPADKDDQKFRHRYLVDGPVTVGDIYTGSGWKTIAVGTAGAGGRSVFALDITNPDSPSLLWELNNLVTTTTVKNNIGHVLGKPVIVPVANGTGTPTWKVVFGNGYNSANQAAALFVVDAATGSAQVITASEGGVAPAYNGIGNIVAIDTQRPDATGAWVAGRDGLADTVYAADQRGALWKFNLNSASVASTPVFIAKDSAGNRQMITGGLAAATGPGGGVMVYFGTGRFSFVGDQDNNATQTLYGILDRGVTISGRSDLQQQTTGTVTGGFQTTSTSALGAGKLGWYLDLPSRHRMVGYPRVESGVVFFPSYEPANNTSSDSCAVNGTNWLFGLNALNGAASLTSVRMGSPTGTQPGSTTGAIALNTGGSAPVKDVAVMTTPRVAPLEAGATEDDINAALAARCSMVVQVAGAPPMYLPRACGRQSWRQVR